MSSKPRILWCSQTPSIHTGYGIITNDILKRLHASGKYEIACHGWHEPPSLSPRYPQEGLSSALFPYKLFCGGAYKPDDVLHDKMGKRNFHDIVDYFKPDVVIMYGDIYMFDYVFDHPDRDKFHLGIYYAIDGAPIPIQWSQTIKKADTAITFSKFGAKATLDRCQTEPLMIYHGIDYPMWSMPLASGMIDAKKKEMFGSSDVFVFGMVARNQPRKNIPAFFESFAAHAKKHPKSRMLLHSVNRDQGWELTLLSKEFGIGDKTYIPQNITPQKGISNQDLRLIYNCMDVHVNTAWGEGFGIPIVESMACGIPNIAPAYSTGPELIDENKAGLTVKPGGFMVEALSHIRRCIIDPQGLLDAMNFMADNKVSLKQYGRNAKTAAAKFDWPKIIPAWETAIDSMILNKDKHVIALERI